MNEYKESAFIEKLYECDQHKLRLGKAKKHLADTFPLNVQKYKELDDVNMGFIDQLTFRFSKLQDTLGDKLFAAFLTLTGEHVKKLTYIDRLNRLEGLGIIDKNQWMVLRKNRNEIAHEYSFNTKDVVESINGIYAMTDILIDIYDNFCKYSKQSFDFIK